MERLRFGGVAIGLALVIIALASLAATMPTGEYFEKGGAAIRGYDPVAYFTDRQPLKGSSSFTAEYKGSTFHFSSASHRDAFVANPEKFAPQYGGFCAYGMAKGYKATTDPAAYTIVGGKLYLNCSLSVRDLWQEDISGNIKKADNNWPAVRQQSRVTG
jgi:YHS domain-containing protein